MKEYERVLQCLDDEAWNDLKRRILSKSYGSIDPLYGYAQIADCLNEAYGYEYLKEQGYMDVKFIPEKQGTKTPELRAVANGETVAVLEVKTIRQSEEEMEYYANQRAKANVGPLAAEDIRVISHSYEPEADLSVVLKEKLTKVIGAAREQLESQIQETGVRRIVYLLFNLDNKLLTITPYDKWVVDKIGSFLRGLSDDKVEIQYRFAGVLGGFLQQYKE